MRAAVAASQAKRRKELRSRQEIIIPAEKYCGRCKVIYPSGRFGPARQNADGLRSYCKKCEVEWAKEKYQKDVDLSRSSAMARYFSNVTKYRQLGRVAASVRRARKLGAGGTHNKADIDRIYSLQRGKCAICLKKVGQHYHVDHITPLAKGGTSWPWNLQILCPNCNQKKRCTDPIDYARQLGKLC